MAYDPKSFLDRALKEGFESVYSQPASAETGEAPQYQGDVATFGDVQVRPLSEPVYEGTGDAAYQVGSTPSGHMVSVPLTGKYEGYFRNDIYDNDGNFIKTTISEPDNDKYGIKALAQLGLTAASFGGLGPLASTLAKGYSAIQSKNPLALLTAATGMPGAENVLPTMPTAINDVLKYAGQASDIAKAVKGDPSAIFKTIVGAAKSGDLPKGLIGDVDLSGADAIEGFFAPGGEGYVPSGMAPNEMAQFLEANVEDPATIDALMRDYFPDLYQTPTLPTDNETAKLLRQQELAQTGESPLAGIGPNAKEVPLVDLSGGTAKTGGTKTATKQTTPTGQQGLDYQKLAYIFGLLGGQRPKEEEQYQAAQLQPLDRELMYGLRG